MYIRDLALHWKKRGLNGHKSLKMSLNETIKIIPLIETIPCACHQDLRHAISMSEIVLFTHGRHLVLHAGIIVIDSQILRCCDDI